VQDRSAPGVPTSTPDLVRPAWVLLAVVVACQIAYPLVHGTARDRLTVTTVLVTLAAVACHAVTRFGAPVAAGLFGVVLVVAAAIETLGVHTGFPFGDYAYGDGLGAELAGVPLVVPAAWAMTAYPALLVARRLTGKLMGRQGKLTTALVGGWALASWDVFLDPQMVEAGHWRWAHPDPSLPGSPDVPLTNYAGWLLAAILLMALLDALAPAGAGDDLMPGALYLWTYAAQVLGNLAFFGRPAVALLGGVAMGLVALPYARTLAVRT
jgi:putative membrane protein